MAVFFIVSNGNVGHERQTPRQLFYFFSCFNISRAAFAPDPPVNPAPGCVPDPHKYKFLIGVL
jgi:hypothetical protein